MANKARAHLSPALGRIPSPLLILDPTLVKESDGCGGRSAEEQGFDAECFDGHQTVIAGIAFSIRRYCPSELGYARYGPIPVGGDAGFFSVAAALLRLH
ncbi:hypothetical protein V6N13_068852 [Hibiscus sabdariffa]|uniref:Uncharacterized protein n=1 Tax=Hibiscus sabdariffa TaxID=183260 RepID=A0ABR2QNW4_9ROSI